MQNLPRLIDANELMQRICTYECGMRPEDCDGMESKTVPCNYHAYISESPTVDVVQINGGDTDAESATTG